MDLIHEESLRAVAIVSQSAGRPILRWETKNERNFLEDSCLYRNCQNTITIFH